MLSIIIFNILTDMNPAVMTMAPPPSSWLEVFMNNFNTSPYFIGFMMLTMNLGSRFLALEMSKGQEAFFSHPWVRRFLIFVVFFIGTRNIWVAFWMALVSILLLGYLFNENSSLCIFKGGLPGAACTKPDAALVHEQKGTQGQQKEGFSSSQPLAPGLTPEEMAIYKQLSEKVARVQAVAPAPAPEKKPDLYGAYKNNIESVKKLF